MVTRRATSPRKPSITRTGTSQSSRPSPSTEAPTPGATHIGRIDPVPQARGVGGRHNMDYTGAGLAALGVLGPGIGIGILGGMAASAIGRNPDAAGQIRGIAIILAAFAEGLGVLAIVVGLLAIFIQPTGA